MAENELSLRVLNVFCDKISGHCSLQCNELSSVNWQAPGVASTLFGLETLKISISERILDETEHARYSTGDPVEELRLDTVPDELLPNLETLKEEAADVSNFTGLVKLLKTCKNLKTLDLRRCGLSRQRRELLDFQSEKFLQYLAEGTQLPRLQVLKLENFVAREEDLLVLLRGNPLRELSLENICLKKPGRWGDILVYWSSNMNEAESGLHEIFLWDLSHDGRNLVFENSARGVTIVKGS